MKNGFVIICVVLSLFAYSSCWEIGREFLKGFFALDNVTIQDNCFDSDFDLVLKEIDTNVRSKKLEDISLYDFFGLYFIFLSPPYCNYDKILDKVKKVFDLDYTTLIQHFDELQEMIQIFFNEYLNETSDYYSKGLALAKILNLL